MFGAEHFVADHFAQGFWVRATGFVVRRFKIYLDSVITLIVNRESTLE